jgi:cell wall assembly regulator SMI1
MVMLDLWQRLEEYLRKHAPAALDFLNPPATQTEIRDAERELGLRFPLDFVASLRVHNGQQPETGNPPHPVEFIPQEYEQGGIYKATFGGLAPLSLLVENTHRCQKDIEEYRANRASGFEFDGPVRRDGNWSWISFVESGSGDLLGMDLKPDKGGKIGQVLSILHDPSCLLVLAPSFRDWFATLVTRFESGRYAFVDEDGELAPIDHCQNPDGCEPGEGNILLFPR